MQLSNIEETLYACCRLNVCGDKENWVASGFFLKLNFQADLTTDILITCRHVIEDARSLSIRIRRAVGVDPIRNPIFGDILIDKDCIIVSHPAEDLCALFIGPFLRKWENEDGVYPAVYSFGPSQICDQSQLDAVEDIVMIGCPAGVYDDFNNHAIVRRGITASHPAFPYQGRPRFLVDCASYAGSSGSPIVRYGPLFFDRKRNRYDLALHPRIALLGMLSCGLDETGAESEARHLNLGVAISSIAIVELLEIAKKRAEVAWKGSG